MADGGITPTVLRWAVKRSGAAQGEGVLLWVDAQGEVHTLGVYAVRALRELHWGIALAYTMATRRDLRSRLAACRETSSRMARAIDLLPKDRPPKGLL